MRPSVLFDVPGGFAGERHLTKIQLLLRNKVSISADPLPRAQFFQSLTLAAHDAEPQSLLVLGHPRIGSPQGG